MAGGPTKQQDQLVQRAQLGDAGALASLRDRFQPALLGILLARGASWTEAEEVLADLWADCVPGAADHPSVLARCGDKSPPLSWLASVARNRWVDRKRRGAKFDPADHHDFDDLPGCPTRFEDDRLQALLRDSLRAAFASCLAEAILGLRLVYLEGLTQREVGLMLGWTESKVSRALTQAMAQIEQQTLKQLRQLDPRLELTWEDFLALCADPAADFL